MKRFPASCVSTRRRPRDHSQTVGVIAIIMALALCLWVRGLPREEADPVPTDPTVYEGAWR